MNTTPNPRLAHLELHIAVLLFGTAGLFGKLITAGPLTIVFGRSLIAALTIFLALKLFAPGLRMASGRSPALMLLSGVVLALHWLTFFHAIQIATVAIGLVGFASFPIFVTWFEPVVSKQAVRAIDVITALMVTVGLHLVAPAFSLADEGTVGLLWAVLSGALFALLTLLNRHLVKTEPAIGVALVQQGVAALVLAPVFFCCAAVPGLNVVWLLLLLGIMCTALPHMLFIRSLATLKAQLASVVAGLEPVYGILFAALLLSEVPDLKTVVGAAVVFSAVLLATWSHVERDAESAAP